MHASWARQLLFGSHGSIAGTVYGSIVVMATLTAGSAVEQDLWRLAAIVATTVVVLWVAHVYAHGLAESIQAGRSLDAGELASVARRELAIPLAAVAPLAALVLGALGVVRDDTAVWVAVVLGLVTLAVQGLRYARVERLGPSGTVLAIGVNLFLGVAIVALKVFVAH
jgi:hypothetical protein